MNRYAVIIPVYNHHHKLDTLFEQLSAFQLDVIMVDDGSEPESAAKIQQAAEGQNAVQLIKHSHNQGKGAAVSTGFRVAHESGYTHVIQIDADMQHDVNDIERFIQASNKAPKACVCGVPVYDESVNKGRFIARYLTHVWVWINTLSLDIQDSMCGYRCYPLSAVMDLMSHHTFGKRMDFDTDIIVRLHWGGTAIINLPTQVVYHQDVPSNFRLFKDNLAISLNHAKLFFGMLLRLPKILFRKIKS